VRIKREPHLRQMRLSFFTIHKNYLSLMDPPPMGPVPFPEVLVEVFAVVVGFKIVI
jgi:hypothetical protein